nr:M15 family metallopeptidase [Gracilibacillus alcaliphilus]
MFIFYQLFIAPEQLTVEQQIDHDIDITDLPSELHPVVAEKTADLIQRSGEIGISIIITDDYRSFEEQDQLYAQGRENNSPVVTHARGGESYHNYGLAIDFALRSDNGEVIWDLNYDGNGNGQSDWLEVVDIAKDLGFEWGGDWEHFKDYPHLQMDFGFTIQELQQGQRPD